MSQERKRVNNEPTSRELVIIYGTGAYIITCPTSRPGFSVRMRKERIPRIMDMVRRMTWSFHANQPVDVGVPFGSSRTIGFADVRGAKQRTSDGREEEKRGVVAFCLLFTYLSISDRLVTGVVALHYQLHHIPLFSKVSEHGRMRLEEQTKSKGWVGRSVESTRKSQICQGPPIR